MSCIILNLLQGPIERPQNLIHQFKEIHKFEYSRVVSGLRLMLLGFFMKIVVADNLSPYVDLVYNSPYNYIGIPLVIATIFFAFQIYCDFAGYSLIALGVSRIMGIELMQNFDSPYFSKSIPEFWRRWHISLSTWFKDYLYIPLGGNKVTKIIWYRNLMLVFVISGIWHGASWNFVIWGLLHGFYQIASSATKNIRNDLYNKLQMQKISIIYNIFSYLFTFFLVCLAWVFFRAKTTSDALYIIKNSIYIFDYKDTLLNFDKRHFTLFITFIIFLLIIDYSKNNQKIKELFVSFR